MRSAWRFGRFIVMPAVVLLLAGCENVRALFTPWENRGAGLTSKPIQKKILEDPYFFRVLTLPTYDTAKEAYDKTAILGIPFRKVARELSLPVNRR